MPAAYELPPQPGEIWVRRGPPQESRRVVDRTLGGDVVYRVGMPGGVYRGEITVTLEEWNKWAVKARERK